MFFALFAECIYFAVFFSQHSAKGWFVECPMKYTRQTPRHLTKGLFPIVEAVYIKAKLEACTSVIMAEAASLALASAIIDRLNLSGANYLSDCEQLVQFLNSDDLSNPPDWRIKHFTQSFSNHSRSRSSKLYKIHRRKDGNGAVPVGYRRNVLFPVTENSSRPHPH